MRILVVEDDPTDLKLVCAILAAEGHEVTAARNAEQGLRILADKLPDLVLTDLALPEMDGVEFTKRLKASTYTTDIPVVAITAYPERFPARLRPLEAGFAAFITKPINPRTLPALLAAASGCA